MTDIYSEILSFLSDKNVRIVADTSGEMLLNILKFKPFLIKPNKDELSEILGISFENDDRIIQGARKLKEMGAVNVLVSLGEDGAVLIDENNQVHRIDAFKIIPVSTVGAGDSMIAGFLAGIDKGYEYALKLGNICGAATASVEILADREKIESMM